MKKRFVVFVFGIVASSVLAQALPGQPRRPLAARSARMMPAKAAVEINADGVLEGTANFSQFGTNEVVSAVLPVRKVPVGNVREAIEALKSPDGKVCVLDDVNSLFVVDISAKVAEMRDCIRRIDAGERMMHMQVRLIKNISPSCIWEWVEKVLRGLSPTSFVMADDRVGKLFVVSPSPSCRMVDDLICRLDDCAERKVSAYCLQWANPSNVAARLNVEWQGQWSRRRPLASDVCGATNGVKTVSAVAMSESGPLIVCGTKPLQEAFCNEIICAESEARPRSEYEVVHTVLKVEDVKTTDEALACVLNLEGKFEAVRSRFFTFRDGESGKDAGQVVSDGGCFRYALTVGKKNKGGELLWSLACSNRYDAVCQKRGTLGTESVVVTIGAAMLDEKTACVFRMSVQSRPLQLSDVGSSEEDCANARPFAPLRRPGMPEYVVSRDFVSVGKGDGTCAISISGGIRELCITNWYADKPVTRIGDFAFAGCTGLGKVIVPEGVTEIGMSAFLGCSGLQCVVLPTTVTNIGRFAFATTESMRVPDIVCATGDKERMRKLIKSVLLRDLPCSPVSPEARLRSGVLLRPDAKQSAMQRQSEVIDEALLRIREISEPEPPPVAKPDVKQDVPRTGLLGGGSLRERRLRRQQEAAAKAQADAAAAEKAAAREAERQARAGHGKERYEAERAEQRAALQAIQEELRKQQEADKAAEMKK